MNKRRVEWSTLPRDLLSSIAERLTSSTDLRHFRAVCTSWRSSSPLPPKSSLKIPFPPSPTICKRDRHLSLTESTIYCIQPLNINTCSTTKSWFIKLQENPTQPDKMLLVDPLSTLEIPKLPKSMPKTINLLNYKVIEICKECNLCVSNPVNISVCIFNREDLKFFLVKKVVTSSTSVDNNFMVIVLLTNGKLSVWKKGDDMWTDVDDKREGSNTHYDDVVFYKGKFYVVKNNGRVLVIDSSFKIIEIASVVGHVDFLNYKHLVVSFGELFLLERCLNVEIEYDNDCPLVYWKVYKLNEETNDWVSVNSLGDRSFFVGCDNSFFVSARDFPGCKGNSIYFDDDIFIKRKGNYPGYNGGIYNLEDGSVGPLSAFPGYSKIFWPPPTWLKQNSHSS